MFRILISWSYSNAPAETKWNASDGETVYSFVMLNPLNKTVRYDTSLSWAKESEKRDLESHFSIYASFKLLAKGIQSFLECAESHSTLRGLVLKAIVIYFS